MGNQPTWLATELRQLPGLISSTFRQIFTKVIPGESSNTPFTFIKNHFATYALVIDGLTSPVAFVDAGNNVFYIVDQIGFIYIYDANLAKLSNAIIEKGQGTLYPSGIVHKPLVDLSTTITPLNPIYEERGLLDMKIHHCQKNLFYLYYTIPSTNPNYNCETVLEEWLMQNNGTSAQRNRIIFQWPHHESNHFGSLIGFNTDGLLYIATGDGGGVGDHHDNAQNIDSPWGKVLTINVDTKIPNIDIYAIGFRNPWRASFTSSGSIVLGEVGQDKYEGVHIVNKNENHGWPAIENGHIYKN